MIGALGFLSPWLLAALIALPLIWLILRLTPPRPRQVTFPPTKLLMQLEDRERTPARTPWWLTLIRLLLVAFIILALAEPVLRPDLKLTTGAEPLLVVLDNGWDAAPDFAERIAAAETAIAEAERDGRPVSFVATAEPRAENLAAGTAEAAKQRLATIVPQAHLPDRPALAARIAETFGERSVEVVWIAGALDTGDGAAFAACAEPRRFRRHDPPVGAPGDRNADAGKPRRRRACPDHPLRRSRHSRGRGLRSGRPAHPRRIGDAGQQRRRSGRHRPARRDPQFAGSLPRGRRKQRRRSAAPRRPLAAKIGRPDRWRRRRHVAAAARAAHLCRARARADVRPALIECRKHGRGGQGAHRPRRIRHRADGDWNAAARYERIACAAG